MFVSYVLKDKTYGFMCFSSIGNIKKLKEFIEDKVTVAIALQFISKYSSKKKHNVQTFTNGIYRNILWNKSLNNVDEINDLYTYLFKKYGFTNILGYQ